MRLKSSCLGPRLFSFLLYTLSRDISSLIGRLSGRNRFRKMCHKNNLDAACTIQLVITDKLNNSSLKDLHKFALF